VRTLWWLVQDWLDPAGAQRRSEARLAAAAQSVIDAINAFALSADEAVKAFDLLLPIDERDPA
jgi:hypothetical protein